MATRRELAVYMARDDAGTLRRAAKIVRRRGGAGSGSLVRALRELADDRERTAVELETETVGPST